MGAQGCNRLELTWTNKDRRLLSHGQDRYEWVDSDDWRVAEVRLLDPVAKVGTTPDDNLLIHGDALHALTSLASVPGYAERYLGKVKLVYIDPPFNTGQAFAHYDDAVEHSVWLTMLRDRLVQIRRLLAQDGSVWVHLDDTEAHRARSVLDEVFGSDNFIATIVWKKANSPRNSTRYLSVDQDYIHVYAKNAEVWRPNRLERTATADASYKNLDSDPRGPWTQSDPYANKPYSLGMYTVVGPTGNEFGPPPGRYWRISKEKFHELDAQGRIWWRGGGEAKPRIKRYLSEVGKLVPRTVWDHSEVGSNGTSRNEVRRLFPDIPTFATPKPERLLQRVLSIGTNPGDIVLDCYAGSGTTAAVAHKMCRRWVAVEVSEKNITSFIRPRLLKVIAGDDPGGVTSQEVPTAEGLPEKVDSGAARNAARTLDALAKAGLLDEVYGLSRDTMRELLERLRKLDRTERKVLWTGGGGFSELAVAPSLFITIDDIVVLAEWATNGRLAEAVCAQFGYQPETDPPFAGRCGKSRLTTIDGMLTTDIVEYLIRHLADKESLLVVAQALEPGVEDYLRRKRPGSQVRKVPRDLARTSRRPSTAVHLGVQGAA